MSTEVRLLAAAVLSALIGAATAGGAQTKGPSPPPSSFQESLSLAVGRVEMILGVTLQFVR